MTKILGIGHYSRVGKDTFANELIRSIRAINPEMKIAKISFASKLKAIAHDLYGWAGLKDEAYYNDPKTESMRDVKLEPLGMTPVEIWVAFGTPAVRDQVYDLTWVDYLLKTKRDLDLLIIPDVRFPNEAAAIHREGGHLLKIVREGHGPRNTVADRALLGQPVWDNIVGDSGCDIWTAAKWYADWYCGNALEPSRPYHEIRQAILLEAS